jgi:O-antigen/teichoic acid export membrane protein
MKPLEIKVGLILAFLLALSDIAIVFALLGDGDHPPLAIVIISVALGVVTLWAVPMTWRRPARAVTAPLIITRILSAIGDLAGLGEDVSVVVVSTIFFVVSLVCLYLLRSYFRSLRRERPVAA